MKIVKKIDESWKHHVHDAAVKLNRAISLLFKIRNFVNVNTLKTIYYAIFDSHIDYMVWAQNLKTVNRVFTLHKKALGIISFQPRHCHSSSLFKKHNLLKFEDKIQVEKVLLVSKYFNHVLPSIFDNRYTHCFDIHNGNTDTSFTVKLFKPSFQTKLY